MRRPWLALAVLLVLVAGPSSRAQGGPLDYPRLANMYWPIHVDSTVVDAVARWDLVVVNSVWTNAQLARLRQLNPDIRIYFYVIAYTVELQPAPGDAWKLGNLAYAATHDLWWYDKNSVPGSDWPNTRMCNITDFAPAGPQGTWKQFIAARIEQLVVSHPDLDGVFFDNFWEQLSWQQQFRQLDSDCNPTHNPGGCNGVADTNEQLDERWNDALRDIAADVRARFDVLQQNRPRPLAILTNNATDYFEYLNGAMTEYFPSGHANVDYGNPYGYNWNQEMLTCPAGYLSAPFRETPYVASILNADSWGSLWAPAGGSEFERLKRFTLVSALLGDGYYSLDAGETFGHGNLWWEPEYDHAGRGKGYLGQALGPMVRILQPTGPEMITNPSFTNGTSDWDGAAFSGGAGSFTTDAAVFHSAPAAARIDVTAAPGNGYYKLWQAPLPLVINQNYTLSFWARASVPQQITMHFYSEECPNSYCWNNRKFCIDTEWQRYEISFRSNATAAPGMNLFVHQTGTVWLDDVSFRQGDTSLFRRDFEHGAVLLNYTTQPQTVDLGGTFWRLRIPNNFVFDGARITSETVPVSDARIFMRDSIPPLPDTTTVSDVAPAVGAGGTLWQNEPNPLNPWTEIRFSVTRAGRAVLSVYDVAGRRVRTLFEGNAEAGGLYRIRWNGRDQDGRALPSGVYFYRLQGDGFTQSRKLVLLQ